MEAFRSKVIAVARSQEGVKEHPRGSNRGPEVDQYLCYVGLDSTKGKYAWCAAFVSWCVGQAAKQGDVDGNFGPPQFQPSSGALKLLQKNRGLRISDPEPECIFVMDHGRGRGHTGFIVSIDEQDPDLLHTIEGNTDANGSRTGGQVMFRTRRVSECAGFLRIA